MMGPTRLLRAKRHKFALCFYLTRGRRVSQRNRQTNNGKNDVGFCCPCLERSGLPRPSVPGLCEQPFLNNHFSSCYLPLVIFQYSVRRMTLSRFILVFCEEKLLYLLMKTLLEILPFVILQDCILLYSSPSLNI